MDGGYRSARWSRTTHEFHAVPIKRLDAIPVGHGSAADAHHERHSDSRVHESGTVAQYGQADDQIHRDRGRENGVIRSPISCYADFVSRSVTITLPEEVADWVRRRAADENLSVSKMIARVLEERMRPNDEYWRAFERWKTLESLPGIDAAGRLSREEAHARR